MRASSTSARSRTSGPSGSSATRSVNQMTSTIAVGALTMAVVRRGSVTGCIVHSNRSSQFRARKFLAALRRHNLTGSMGQARMDRRIGSADIRTLFSRLGVSARTFSTFTNFG